MFSLNRLLPCVFLPLLSMFGGCAATSSEYWHSPSILTTAPPDPPKQIKHETQGGFSVLVEAPGQPTAARVIRDIGAFAQRRGFARQGDLADGARYSSGQMALDVVFRASDSHVLATLHSFKLSQKFAESFYRDFDHEFGRQYGDEDPIIESDFGNDFDSGPGGGNTGRGNRSGGGGNR